MASKRYVCTNFANCDKALAKESIEIEDGEELVCPGCQAKLQAPGGGAGGGGGLPKAAIAAVAGVLAIAALAFVFWHKGPDPEMANTMLMDFFPRLK